TRAKGWVGDRARWRARFGPGRGWVTPGRVSRRGVGAPGVCVCPGNELPQGPAVARLTRALSFPPPPAGTLPEAPPDAPPHSRTAPPPRTRPGGAGLSRGGFRRPKGQAASSRAQVGSGPGAPPGLPLRPSLLQPRMAGKRHQLLFADSETHALQVGPTRHGTA